MNNIKEGSDGDEVNSFIIIMIKTRSGCMITRFAEGNYILSLMAGSSQ